MTRSTKLISAHRYCHHLAKSHYENFPVASIILPKHIQQSVFVIYAFARTADDIADEGSATKADRMQALLEYEKQLNNIEQGADLSQPPLFIALSDVVYSQQLPIQLFHDLLTAFKQDISQGRYQSDDDILDYLSKNNKVRPKIVVGFSAETENVILNSKLKIKEKYCDLIIANDVSKKETGFNSDYNKVSIIDKKGQVKSIPKNKKSFIANIIARIILDKLLMNDKNIN